MAGKSRKSRNFTGGRSRARTCGLSLVRAALFQLSYPPVPGLSRTCASRSTRETADVPGPSPAVRGLLSSAVARETRTTSTLRSRSSTSRASKESNSSSIALASFSRSRSTPLAVECLARLSIGTTRRSEAIAFRSMMASSRSSRLGLPLPLGHVVPALAQEIQAIVDEDHAREQPAYAERRQGFRSPPGLAFPPPRGCGLRRRQHPVWSRRLPFLRQRLSRQTHTARDLFGRAHAELLRDRQPQRLEARRRE